MQVKAMENLSLEFGTFLTILPVKVKLITIISPVKVIVSWQLSPFFEFYQLRREGEGSLGNVHLL